MLLDSNTQFSENQAVTTGTIVSSLGYDLGATGNTALGDTPISDPGRAFHGKVFSRVTEAFVGGTSVQAQLVSADNAGLTSNVTVLQETAAIPTATLKLGYEFRFDGIPPGVNQRYLGMRYVVVGTYTAGKITSGLTWVKDNNWPI